MESCQPQACKSHLQWFIFFPIKRVSHNQTFLARRDFQAAFLLQLLICPSFCLVCSVISVPVADSLNSGVKRSKYSEICRLCRHAQLCKQLNYCATPHPSRAGVQNKKHVLTSYLFINLLYIYTDTPGRSVLKGNTHIKARVEVSSKQFSLSEMSVAADRHGYI